MQSDATSVDTYVDEVPDERHAAVDALREACRNTLAGFDEAMAYGMPSYSRNGEVEVAFASQKSYISLYIPPDVLEEHRALLSHLNVGKSCIRFRKPTDIDPATVQTLLDAVAGSTRPST